MASERVRRSAVANDAPDSPKRQREERENRKRLAGESDERECETDGNRERDHERDEQRSSARHRPQRSRSGDMGVGWSSVRDDYPSAAR